MSKRILLGIADQVLASDLNSRIEALDDYTVVHISESGQELLAAALNHDPDVVIIDRDLPPGPLSRVTHDLTRRKPALPILLAARSAGEDSLALALEVGARGILTYPFVLAEVNDALVRALEWGERMQSVLSDEPEAEARGGVVVLAGSKGGVGTTVLTTHTAWWVAQHHPDLSICLVDLDLEKGDVPSFVDLNYRVSIVDLAKIADDINETVVRDTVAVHDSGLHILPAPSEIRDVDLVSPGAIRSILSQLRQMYDVVLVDAGSNVTPAQAAAVEIADHAVQVVTTDVPALRAARRQVQTWSDLGVRAPADVRVLVNRYSRDAEIQQSTVDRLVLGRRMEALVPDLGRGLEPAVNTRTPSQGAPKSWWRAVEAVVAEAGLLPVAPEREPQRRRLPGFGRPKAEQEAGQMAIETVGVLPITVVLILLLWELVGLALSFVWAGEAANAAAREAALGSPPTAVVHAAQDAVPGAVRGSMQVNSTGGNVQVSVKLAPWGAGTVNAPVGTDRRVVMEPGA